MAFVFLTSAWKLPWKEREINLLSSLPDIPPCFFLAPPATQALDLVHMESHTLLDQT